MNNKQLHLLLGLFCMAILITLPVLFVKGHLFDILPLYVILLVPVFTMFTIWNHVTLVGILHREKDEQGIEIGLGYGLYCIANILFIAFWMVASLGCIVLCWWAYS